MTHLSNVRCHIYFQAVCECTTLTSFPNTQIRAFYFYTQNSQVSPELLTRSQSFSQSSSLSNCLFIVLHASLHYSVKILLQGPVNGRGNRDMPEWMNEFSCMHEKREDMVVKREPFSANAPILTTGKRCSPANRIIIYIQILKILIPCTHKK